jgi:hypothetical protein
MGVQKAGDWGTVASNKVVVSTNNIVRYQREILKTLTY